MSATRRSGNFWWTLRRREKLINPEYGEVRRIWETPGTGGRAHPRSPAEATARRAFSLRLCCLAGEALPRRTCDKNHRWKAAMLRTPASTGRGLSAWRPATPATALCFVATAISGDARWPDPCARWRIPTTHAPIRWTGLSAWRGNRDNDRIFCRRPASRRRASEHTPLFADRK